MAKVIALIGGTDNSANPTEIRPILATPEGLLRVDVAGLTVDTINIGTITQGTPNSLANAWPVFISDGTNSLGTTAHPLIIGDGGNSITIDGSVTVSNFPASQAVTGTFFQATQPVSNAGTFAVQVTSLPASSSGLTNEELRGAPVRVTGLVSQSGTWNVGTVTSITNVVHVDDNASSLTVDGTFWQTTQPVSLASVPTHTVTGPLTNAELRGSPVLVTGQVAQSGTWNVGTVTGITNVVHVDDNAGSLTVDNAGTFAVQVTSMPASASSLTNSELRGAPVVVTGLVSQSGTWNIGTLTTITNPVAVTDNSGSLTVDNSGTFAVQVTSLPATSVGLTNAELRGAAVPITGQVSQSGTWNVGTLTSITNVVHVDDNAGSLTIDDGGSSITIDGTASVAQSGFWDIRNITGTIPSHAVTGPLTNSELRGSPVVVTGQVSQSGTWNIGTLTTITNPVAVTDNNGSLTVDGTFFQSVQPVSGPLTNAELHGSPVIVTGQVSQSGTWNIGTLTTITNPVHVDDNSGSLTVDNNGTFAVQVTSLPATSVGLTNVELRGAPVVVTGQVSQSGNWDIRNITGTIPSHPVTGPLTSAELHGSPLIVTGQVSQSGTWNVGTLTSITNVVHVDDNASSLTVDNAGTFAVQVTSMPASASSLTNAELRGAPVVVTGQVAQSGVWNIGTLTTITNAVPVTDNSGSLTVDNAGTFAVQVTSMPASASSLTNPELRGAPVVVTGQVSQSGTWNVGTLTSITNVVHVDDNASSLTVDNAGTFAVQVTSLPAGSSSLTNAELRGAPVVVTGLVSQSGTWNINNVSGTVTLPTDAATQTTLALIKAKTDNLNTTLTGGGTHVVIDSMPPVSAQSSALVVTTASGIMYSDATTQALTQTLEGRLRVEIGAMVSDSLVSYLDGTIQPLSLTTEGRLRVSSSSPHIYINFFNLDEDAFGGDGSFNPWGLGMNNSPYNTKE